MSYHLLNTKTGKAYTCSDELWLNALKKAEENGWDPEGTAYDFDFEAELADSDMHCMFHPVFMILTLYMDSINWDGSYTERENQLVNETDGYYLMLALEGTSIDKKLVSFTGDGEFRICRE